MYKMTLKFEGGKQSKAYSSDFNNMAYANYNAVLTDCAPSASSPAAMTVEASQGKVFFGINEVAVAADTLTIDENTSSNPRIDLIAIDSNGDYSVIKGANGAVPTPPDYEPDDYIITARVYVAPDASEITDSAITDIRVLNQGGAAGGSGSGGVNRYKEDFADETTLTVTHNLADAQPIVQVYDNNNEQIIPDTIDVVDQNTVDITFASSTTGFVVIHGGIGGSAYYSESYSSSTTWNVNHNMNRKYVTVQCYDDSDNLVEPQSVNVVDEDNCTVTFGTATAGHIVVSGGSTQLKTISSNEMNYNNVSVDTTTTQIVSSNNRKILYLRNNGSSNLYIGDSSVTTSDGYEIIPGDSINITSNDSVYGISSSTIDIRYIEIV